MESERIIDPDGAADWRDCLRDPIPEIALAAKILDAAVTAHLCDQRDLAGLLIGKANLKVIGEWAFSLRGKSSVYNRSYFVEGSPSRIEAKERTQPRMPSLMLIRALHQRDGFHCRFCGVPVIARGVRTRLVVLYPEAVRWGPTNLLKHTALDALEAQYDHLLPHSRGGSSELNNLVITCNPCNYGRGERTLAEMHLTDPLLRQPVNSDWDGLERLLQ